MLFMLLLIMLLIIDFVVVGLGVLELIFMGVVLLIFWLVEG